MKTLTYQNLRVNVGISHQLSNLTAMMREAYVCGRSLLPPLFNLSGEHNYGRQLRSTMGEYFDFASAEVNHEHLNIISVATSTPHQATASFDVSTNLTGRTEDHIVKDVAGTTLLRKPIEKLYPAVALLKVQLPLHLSLQVVVDRAIADIPSDAAWIHVRRGDLLHKTATGTSPENIHKVIQAVSPKTKAIYLATNEINLEFFQPLTEWYDVACMKDFDAFVGLAFEDNYKLFLVEQAFGRMFPVRISTFKTKDRGFHGWLCEDKGWQ